MASLDALEDRLSCGLCMELFDEDTHVPKLLHCAHSLCKPCLQSLTTSSSSGGSRSFPCPFCRENIPVLSITRYRSNLTLLDMLPLLSLHSSEGKSSGRKSSEESEVQSLDLKSTEEIRLSEARSQHGNIQGQGKSQGGGECPVHGNPVTCFCNTCELNLCTECLLKELREESHKGHSLVTVSDGNSVQKNSNPKPKDRPPLQSSMSLDRNPIPRQRLTAVPQHFSLDQPSSADDTERVQPVAGSSHLDDDLDRYYPESVDSTRENTSAEDPRTSETTQNLAEDPEDGSSTDDENSDNILDFLDEVFKDYEPVVESVRVMYQEADEAFRDVENTLVRQEQELEDTATEMMNNVQSEVVAQVQRGMTSLMGFFR